MSTQEWVVIERTIDAPVGVVWEMWTDPDHFAQWYGPMGAAMPVVEMDVRVGGTRRMCMEMPGPDGTMQMWFTGEFREVVPDRRLVYTDAMCDEAGNILPPSAMGMPEGHPEVTEVTVELEDIGGSTQLTLTHVGVPKGSPGEGGWNMALDKLAEQLRG